MMMMMVMMMVMVVMMMVLDMHFHKLERHMFGGPARSHAKRQGEQCPHTHTHTAHQLAAPAATMRPLPADILPTCGAKNLPKAHSYTMAQKYPSPTEAVVLAVVVAVVIAAVVAVVLVWWWWRCW